MGEMERSDLDEGEKQVKDTERQVNDDEKLVKEHKDAKGNSYMWPKGKPGDITFRRKKFEER